MKYDNTNRLADAEKCIGDIDRNLISLSSFSRIVFENIIKAWRKNREAK